MTGEAQKEAPETPLDVLLAHLKRTRGFDFTGYKRASLERRIRKRMETVEVADYGEYLDYLEVHPDEFGALFDTILINVTGFFRDPEAWESLRTEVLEPITAEKPPEAPIRLWSAGCASGEEAYTLAMEMAEILGPERFRQRVKIYATDVDEEQLNEARHATYGARQAGAVPPELLERYFDAVGDRYVFRKDLRRSVIFGRNDLVQDAPISRIDVLACRNTLMYFNAETQARILSRFHFALVDDGALFLGKAEMLLSHAALFRPSDLKRRVFRKVPRPAALNGAFADLGGPYDHSDPISLEMLRGEAFLADPVARIIVTSDGLVALSNRRADTLFGVSARDAGRPFRDLEVSYRPTDLRTSIDLVQAERRAQRLTGVEYEGPAEATMYLDVEVNPLISADTRLLGIALVFHDVTEARRLRGELEHVSRELETAYEELQSTVEELETTNEELQSTVEELETTNEELQSTNEELETMNEELETMNEELQSSNDELQSMNDALQASSAELDRANRFLDSVLAGLRAGVVVVDRDLQVRVWNRRAENLWGLRAEEVVAQSLLNLDIGLPVERVLPLLKQALAGEREVEGIGLEAVNRRGRSILVRVACSPLIGLAGEAVGAIIILETDDAVSAAAEDPPGWEDPPG
jgi:two-component system, chemotaxis family, CheB/CheR fusion protein